MFKVGSPFLRIKPLKLTGILILLMLLSLLLSTNVQALTASNTTTTATRNNIAKNWTYHSRGYAEQNCLSFALNKGNVWTWPWGSKNPTVTQAKSYLSEQGYKHLLNASQSGPLPNTEVYAYVLNNGVTHFAKQVSGALSFRASK